jgi:hypothetical protein
MSRHGICPRARFSRENERSGSRRQATNAIPINSPGERITNATHGLAANGAGENHHARAELSRTRMSVPKKKKSCRSIRYDSSFFSKSARAYAQANFEFALANVGNSRSVDAELERSSLFTTASAESDSNDSGSENDSALHGSISCCVPK